MGIPVVTRTAEDFAAEQLGALPGGLLSDEGTRRIIEDLALTVGDVQVLYTDPLLAGLEATISAESCPESCLDGLLSLMGISASVTWVRGLTIAERRTLALLAPALWRLKGTPDGTRALYRFLSRGNDYVSWDWPFWRYEVGGEVGGIVLNDPVAGGAWERMIHLSDPRSDVNRSMVLDAMRFVGAAAESVTLLWCLVAEPFLQGLSRWTVAGAPKLAPGEVTLPAGAALSTPQTDLPIARVLTSLQVGAGATAEIRIGDPATVEYVVALGNGACSIEASIAGVPAVLATSAPVVAADLWYLVDVRIWTTVAGVEVEVWLDGVRVAVGSV